ncbi:MAG: M1 family aminopeptidase [Terracidiphilus sp.]
MRSIRTRGAIGVAALAGALLLRGALSAQQPGSPAPAIAGYAIDAELNPTTHRLTVRTVVRFTLPAGAGADPDQAAPSDSVLFGLDPALQMNAVFNEAGARLHTERTAGGDLRVTPAVPLARGQMEKWTFTYAGTLAGGKAGSGSATADARQAFVGEPVSWLPGASHWFPVAASLGASLTNRFTARMRILVPAGMRVFASGRQGNAKPVTLSDGQPGAEYDFDWGQPGRPGTVIAGHFLGPFPSGAANVQVWLTASHQQWGNEMAQAAAQQFAFFSNRFGAPESSQLNVVDLPDGAPLSVWAPELAALRGSLAGTDSGTRLLANTIAHQWWGSKLSPRTLNDAWITNGMDRYSELIFVEHQNGRAAFQAAVSNVAAGALAYDTTPLSSAGQLNPFSAEFQTMTDEKGAMIFHMLRWELGDAAFFATLRDVLGHSTDGMIDTAGLQKAAETEGRRPMSAFFTQWADGTGAPRFTDKYAIYRLGNNKGFRVIGELDQNLDLFRMPVELSVETAGQTETKRIEVQGPATGYVVNTFGRPLHVRVDPEDWVLKSTPELETLAAILRGQQLASSDDLNGALAEYRKALDIEPQSSLVSFRIGQTLFALHNYQASVDAFRDALSGDGQPPWTEIWSHIEIGKIFDLTGQRDRAVNEYRLAVQTGDNSQGGVNQAQMYLKQPYQRSGGK